MSDQDAKAHADKPFKKCGSCGKEWPHWQDFVLDPSLRALGLQAYPELPDANLLVFEHRCGTSVSVLAKRLRKMFPDPEEDLSAPLLFGTETCSGHCRYLRDLEACGQKCRNATDRNLMLRLLEMRRKAGSQQ